MKKSRFIIIGSGWRALYYVRIAKALPEYFELCAMYCRSEEKAEKISSEYDIHTTTSIKECEELSPDFVVVCVTKSAIADVSMEWMKKGFTVLCETPVALSNEKADEIAALCKSGCKLVVAEQYRLYPVYSSITKIINSGIIGDPTYVSISLAHDYHGMSLARAFLKEGSDSKYKIRTRVFEFPSTETLTRYEKITDGRIANKKRKISLIEFEDNKVALYDFDSEQYRSPIRNNTIKIQGTRGEIVNNTVYYLDENNVPHTSQIDIQSHVVNTIYDNPNLSTIEEIESISFNGKELYTPAFGRCGLAQDETAIAQLMYNTALYSRDECAAPYSIDDAICDAKMSIEMTENT